jgi:beta-N-acetylhexosaminidase
VAGYRSVSNTSQAQPAAHLAAALERYGVTADLFETGTTPSAATIANAVARAGVSDLVVVATANASGTTSSAVAQRNLVSALIATGKPVVLIATRNPYDIAWIPQTSTYLATYSWTKPSMQAVARVLFGEINPSGKLPVTVPAPDGSVLYPYGHGLSY